MVAMQNIKGVPEYPLDCKFKMNTAPTPAPDGGAGVCEYDGTTTCTTTYQFEIETGKTIDGDDSACAFSEVSATCGTATGWTDSGCDTGMSGAYCECEVVTS